MRVSIESLRRWLLVILLCGMLAAMPVFAQDEEATEEPAAAEAAEEGEETQAAAAEEAEEADEEAGESPQGVEILFLLLGIAAVLLVGGASIGQEAFRKAEAEGEKHE